MELSIVATCLGDRPTSMLTCPSLPACPSCPTNFPCLPDDSGSSWGSNSGFQSHSGSRSDGGSGSVSGTGIASGFGDNSGVTSLPSPLNGAGSGPCPSQGYLCDDCVNGWFCPPPLTPALPAPCGYGWPCYHCSSGWFCIQSPTTAPETGAVVEITITSTQSLTVFETAATAETIHPATAGWQYGGCYKDDTVRALQNESITAKMNVDSWRIAESDCSVPCEGEPEFVCGGNLALSIWSITGRVPKAPGPKMNFTLPTLSPGQTEMADFTGAVRQSLVPMTSAEEVSTTAIVTDVALKNKLANPTAIDAEGIASSVRAIVSVALDEVQRMAASEVARAKAMIDEAHTVVG
ncbi:hypothetical protein B0T09DRAFT_393218 [Sordaria sp. MPI-SDFR-AT-0083]|nr:hypothetical protein B0T09DRAFT_393218 [Sordaria sp. MPI-SDFR-AT-0083]